VHFESHPTTVRGNYQAEWGTRNRWSLFGRSAGCGWRWKTRKN